MIIFITSIVAIACSNNESEPAVNEEESIEETEASTIEQEDTAKDEPIDEVTLGDTEVFITGTARYEDHVLTLEGQTNLIEGAKLTVVPRTLDRSTLIGVTSSTRVESDGSFSYEVKIPKEYEYGLNLGIRFRPEEASDEEIHAVYGEGGEKLEGPFIRSYEYIDELFQEAYTSAYLPLEDGDSVEAEFGDPGWEKPADSGDVEIRMQATAEAGKDFIDIQGESNFIEGVELSVSHLDEDDRNINSSRNIRTNPDGSFRAWIKIDDEVDEIDETYIEIGYHPTQFGWKHTVEQYGENGEKMTGELVEDGNVTLKIPITE